MKARITFDDNNYIKHLVTDANGEYELPDDFDIEFVFCYVLVNGKIYLDENKKAEQIRNGQITEEIFDLQQKLNESDYIIARTFEEIMSLDSSVTFIADFIKILKQFRQKYSDMLSSRRAWRERIEELNGNDN